MACPACPCPMSLVIVIYHDKAVTSQWAIITNQCDCWDVDMAWVPPAYNFCNMNNHDDVAFIGKVLDDLSTKYPIDPTKRYVAGSSNGGMLAYLIACKHPGGATAQSLRPPALVLSRLGGALADEAMCSLH